MVLTPEEYAAKFKVEGKTVSAKTIKRRCENNTLPSAHIPHFKSNVWIIEIAEVPASFKNIGEIQIRSKRKYDI